MIAYLITCLPSGLQYIGITKHSTTRNRWRNHVGQATRKDKTKIGPLQRSIIKYGREAFTIEHIATARTWDNLCLLEAILITQYGTMAPGGYNLTTGGQGTPGTVLSKEHREKIGAANSGLKRSPESIERHSAAMRGKKQSPEHVAKRAEKLKGRKMPPWTEEHRAKQSAAHAGQPGFPMKQAHKELLAQLNRHLNTGKKHSLETCAKRSASLKIAWATIRTVQPGFREQTIARNIARTGSKDSSETLERKRLAQRTRRENERLVKATS